MCMPEARNRLGFFIIEFKYDISILLNFSNETYSMFSKYLIGLLLFNTYCDLNVMLIVNEMLEKLKAAPHRVPANLL